VFAYIHISMRLTVCPPPGAALAAPFWPLASCALLLASSALMAWARRLAGGRPLPWLVLAALGCMVAAFACDANGQRLAGLNPGAQAWDATIATLLAYQGLHVVALVIAALYLCARAWSGKVTARSRATLDNTALIWHYTSLQGIAAAAAIHAVPQLMG
jgi:cytochrome c oxidase subunit I+III